MASKEDSLTPAIMDMDDGSALFFKVVALHPGNLKVVKSNRKRLENEDIAVTLHKGELLSPNQGTVDSLPSHCSDATASAVHVLAMMGLETSKLEQIQRWSRMHQCHYALPHFSTPQVGQLIADCFAVEALEGKSGAIQATAETEQLLQELLFEGWVTQVAAGWKLSRAGVRQLHLAHAVKDPQPITDLVLMDQQHPTVYSLLVKLENDGWEWRKKPTRAQLMLPYVVGGPKLFFSPSNVVRLEYLMCLWDSPRVLGPGVELHHCKKPLYYERILAGDMEGALEVLNAEHRQERRALKDDDDEAQSVRPMLADDGFLWQEVAPAQHSSDAVPLAIEMQDAETHNSDLPVQALGSKKDARGGMEDSVDVGIWEFEDDVAEGVDVTLPSASSRDLNPHPEPDLLADVANVATVASSSSSREPQPAPTTSDPGHSEARIARVVQPETLEAWGDGVQKFRITWRKPNSDCKNGSWQGICPYHAKGPKTKCTKALTVQSNTEEARTACLRMIQHWLVSATSFDRAWKHSEFNPRFVETPPFETLIEKSKVMPLAPSGAPTDAELDKEATAKAKSKAKAKGKPKGKAKSRAKEDSSDNVSVLRSGSASDNADPTSSASSSSSDSSDSSDSS